MNKLILVSALFAGLMSGQAMANADMAKAKNCMSCHSVDKKLVGPSFKDVAAKYKGQNVADKLAAKIKAGGSGVWGPIPMPANNVSDAEAKQLAQWILATK